MVKSKINIDKFRIIAAILVVAIHTYPLLSINETLDFLFTHCLCRIGVPIFLMITGFFILPKALKDRKKLINYTVKIIKIYVVCMFLYLPINIYAGKLEDVTIIEAIKDIFINGTFYHLWYFPALILGIWITYFLVKYCKPKIVAISVFLLYVIGILGDSYFGICENISVISNIYKGIFAIFDYTRNGLFYVPIFLYLGYSFSKTNYKISKRNSLIFMAISILLMLFEGLVLYHFKLQRHYSMYFFLIPVMFFLFNVLLQVNNTNNKKLRDIATIIYIIHPLFIVFVRGVAKVIHLESLMVDNSIIHYLLVVICSVIFAVIYEKIKEKIVEKSKGEKVEEDLRKNRAWIEINLDNLSNNINEIKSVIPAETKVMAVVKANAYGHGIIEISKKLNEIGVEDFAVATLSEGIALRKANITGNILILGYTDIENIKYVQKYNLMQTVLDYEYAKKLDEINLNDKIKVHIKINTGMNRIGESYTNIDNIIKMYQLKNVEICGIYTHLCSADTLNEQDIEFTNTQIRNFYSCIDKLKSLKYDVGKIHIQASYGILNYNDLKCDYVRPGIIMYGVYSSKEAKITKAKLNLKPVLSLKARVVTVKNIEKAESVSYGRTFVADKAMKIATVSIGYADGYPRNLSNNGAIVKINGEYANIIGRICMDQLIVDVTEIKNVKTGDVVTLIGDDENISAEEVANKSNTITNELLSRLGDRLDRVVTNDKT